MKKLFEKKWSIWYVAQWTENLKYENELKAIKLGNCNKNIKSADLFYPTSGLSPLVPLLMLPSSSMPGWRHGTVPPIQKMSPFAVKWAAQVIVSSSETTQLPLWQHRVRVLTPPGPHETEQAPKALHSPTTPGSVKPFSSTARHGWQAWQSSLHGGWSFPHSRDSSNGTMQSPLLQQRVLDWVPIPHVFEQPLQSAHSHQAMYNQ